MNIQIKDRLYDEFLKEPTKDNFGDGKFTWRNYYYWGGRAV